MVKPAFENNLSDDAEEEEEEEEEVAEIASSRLTILAMIRKVIPISSIDRQWDSL